MEYRLQSMYNHMVGRTASVVPPFYSLLPDVYRMSLQLQSNDYINSTSLKQFGGK